MSLVAASLADVSPLPASLKQVAGFAPARRARLGAAAIMSELERDDELRERVAVQVRVRATGEPGTWPCWPGWSAPRAGRTPYAACPTGRPVE